MTAREAAELLNVSVFHIARLAQTGALPTAMQAPGKRGARFFYQADVEALVTA